MENTKKAKMRKPPTVVLIAIIALVVLMSGTLAWLTIGDAVTTRIYSLSNFDAYAEVYFMDGTTKTTPTKSDYDSIEVNYTDSNAPNYIGKLRVDAQFKGRGFAYIRLKMVQQWQDGSDKILQSDAVVPYDINIPYLAEDTGDQNKWYDNRRDDFCLYFANRLSLTNAAFPTDNDNYVKIPVIVAGFDAVEMASIAPSDAVSLKTAFILEAVQVNRYPQFWGIDTLPWLE